jgi:hypothetical protein
MLDRRRFLIGAGGLLTAAFVRKASAFSRKIGEPLVLPTARRPEETLYIYWQDQEYEESAKWRVSLGPNQPFAPPPPTWREHLRSLGRRLETSEDIERACIEHGLLEEELDAKVNGFSWEDRWDNFAGPQAKAHHLLKTLDLRAPDSKLRQAGQIFFESFGAGPGNSYHWVRFPDLLRFGGR